MLSLSRTLTILILLISFPSLCFATEKTDWDYPLGQIGARCYLQLGENSVRVSEIDAGGTGAQAGLKVNDFIYGAFDIQFEKAVKDTWNIYVGPMKGLGEAIEKARRSDGILPLMVIRPGTGSLTLNVKLPADGGFGPAYPLGSASFEEAYERAVASIHENTMNETWRSKTGSKYSSFWIGLALLSHPDWNSTTGDKPYRLSINAIRDRCLDELDFAQYAPVEQYLLDGTANPNFVDQFRGHENWALNVAMIFLSEYLQKTKDERYYDEFQTAAEKLSNRIQWWSDRTGRRTPAGGAHAGVHSDYNNCGFNICTSSSFAALSMASQVTDADGNKVLDLTVRPRDGRHFGYAEGETKPANALPELPDGWDINVDPSIAEKMAWQWQQLKESAHPEFGAVHYWHGLENATFGRDGSARTAAATFGYNTYVGDNPVPASEQEPLARMTDFSVRFNREHQYAHTHTISGVVFNHMAMPYWTSQQRRYFFENWKFYWNLAQQTDGPPVYFTTLFENDDDCHYLLGELFTALPYGIARGGLSLIPGWDTDELIIDFHQTLHTWDQPEFRTLVTDTGSIDFLLSLTNSLGQPLTPDSVSWTQLSGPAASSITNSNNLSTGITFPADGTYMLQLTATHGSRSVTEKMRIHVHTRELPAGYAPGADYNAFADTGIGETIVSIYGTGDWIKTTYILDYQPISESMATKISGYLIPRESGNYRFYLASRNDSVFYIDLEGENFFTTLCQCTKEPADYDWTADAEQESASVYLEAGHIYPFQVLHRCDRFQPGPLAVGWTTPSNPNIELMDSSVLAHAIDESTPSLAFNPIESVTRAVGDASSITCRVNSPSFTLYQWYKDGKPIGDPKTSYILKLSPLNNGSAGTYHCVATTDGAVFTSTSCVITITNADTVNTGNLTIHYFTETEGNQISDLTDDPGYPWLIDGYGTLSSFYYKTSVQNDNHLGHRVTGWLVPTETANYRFFACGDDKVELYLSGDEYREHKSLIAANSDVTGERSWSDGRTGKSDYIHLEAGKRYFIELLQKEDRGASHFAVSWQKEGDPMPTNGQDEIPGTYFESLKGGHFNSSTIVPPYFPHELYLYSYLGDTLYYDPEKGGAYGHASGSRLSNTFYYLFNLGDPQNPAITPLSSGISYGTPVIQDATGSGFTYSYVHPRSDNALGAYAAVSTDLLRWLPVTDPAAAAQPTSSSTETIDSDYEIRHLHFPATDSPLFFRMEIPNEP